jgi:site-specific DNA-methyltransferase (adenine-specific)
VDGKLDRLRAAQAQGERQPVPVPDLAPRARNLRDAQAPPDDDERNHLGPARAVDGGSIRSFSSVHDTIGFFVKRKDYYFDLDAVRIPYDAATKKARSRSIFIGAKWLEVGYNPKDLWSVSRLHREHAERVEHPTQKPLEIIERMVKASCPPGGIVLDPFMGSGTTALAAQRLGRHFTGFELNADYCAVIQERLAAPEAPVKKRPVARKKTTTVTVSTPTRKTVAPAKAGAQFARKRTQKLDPRLRGDDGLSANGGISANDVEEDVSASTANESEQSTL